MERVRSIIVISIVPLAALSAVFLFAYPSVRGLRFENPQITSWMEEQGLAVKQNWVPLERISPRLREAVVVAEDANFYRHGGIDFEELKKTFRLNWRRREYVRGFSTLTMQLAKNLYLSKEKTILRKLRQILIALRMERELSKDRILEIYLNVVEWGEGIYGAEAASQHYFHKPASDLLSTEAAFLAAILPNPREWGHWPPGPYVRRRQMTILARMGVFPETSP